jgi:hypothetical protein
MDVNFRQTTEADVDQLRSFLKAVFHARDGEPLIDPRQMRWKLYEPRPDWVGSRSYVLMKDGEIVAHSSIVPVTFLTPQKTVSSLNPLDWGASQVGGGVQLLRKLHRLSDTFLGLDAAQVTYDLLKKLRYRIVGQQELFSRVVRPVRAFRTDLRRQGVTKASLKLLRNSVRTLRAGYDASKEWSVVRVRSFDDAIQEVLPRRGFRAFTPVQRSAAVLNYMLRCPVAEFSGFVVHHRQRARGYFLLSRVGSQARIADIHVDSEDPSDWDHAVSLATRAAAADARVIEILAGAAFSLVRNAIMANGYRRIASEPIFLFDPKDMLADAPEPGLSLIDGDSAYL